MITWPDIQFPPVNLYSLPLQSRFSELYIKLELEFTKEVLDKFYKEPEDSLSKELLRIEVLDKRKEFNKLWNARARG